MPRVLINNIGEFFTGDLASPISPARSLLIEEGRVAAFDPADPGDCEVVIDARGSAVMPGLVDGHVHPVCAEWTPTQNATGWIGNYVHGGTTTLISAGEVHFPGLDPTKLSPELVTSLAIVMAQTTGRVRWSGAKLIAGTVILVPGMKAEHFDRIAAHGTKFAKFLFYPLDTNKEEAQQYVRWCRERKIRVKVHTGGVSRSGTSVMCGYDILSWLKPDIAAHVSGGPIPMTDEDLDSVVDDPALSSVALEVCSAGNYGSTARVAKRLLQKGKLDRLCMGTDTPGGTGVIPRGMFKNILFLTSIAGLTPGQAIAIATGNTARAHGLDTGILANGRPADIVVCGPVKGSKGTTLTDAIAHGDLPGVSHVLIDGLPVVRGRSRQTPPPQNAAVFSCCNLGWLSGGDEAHHNLT
jgi:enamidase